MQMCNCCKEPELFELFSLGSALSQKFPFSCNNCYTKRQNSIKHTALVILVQLIRRGGGRDAKSETSMVFRS